MSRQGSGKGVSIYLFRLHPLLSPSPNIQLYSPCSHETFKSIWNRFQSVWPSNQFGRHVNASKKVSNRFQTDLQVGLKSVWFEDINHHVNALATRNRFGFNYFSNSPNPAECRCLRVGLSVNEMKKSNVVLFGDVILWRLKWKRTKADSTTFYPSFRMYFNLLTLLVLTTLSTCRAPVFPYRNLGIRCFQLKTWSY